jgi:hypothetical protein
MSLFEIAVLLGFSIVIALVIGIVRFKKLPAVYYPFMFVVGLGFGNHLLNLIMVYYFRSNAVNGNIYVLLETLLYLWLFANWGLFKKKNTVPLIITVVLITGWFLDNLVLHSLQTPNAGFRILSSLILVILSVEQIVQLLPRVKGNILHNAVFIICTGLLLHFSFKACIEVFFLIQKDVPITLHVTIYSVLIYVNCFVNLLFAWAMICIPKKQQYLLLY